MNKPLLSVFADGVRYDSLKYMPFLNSLNSIPLRSILGYSITCHPSMYTGVNPDKHKIAFHWVKSKDQNGPYAPLSFLPNIFPFTNPYAQAVISHFYAKIFLKKKCSPFMGYGKILNLSIKFWKHLDINEKKYWDEEGYVNENIKTIFELVRKNKIRHHISRLHKPNLGLIDSIKVVAPTDYDWVYYFVGELDSVSHEYLQHSNEGQHHLRKLDDFIRVRYTEFAKEYGEKKFNFVFWSDHGHIPIKNKYNLYEHFKINGFKLNKVFHIIDSTTVRFWPTNSKQEEAIAKIMEKIAEANLVSKTDFGKLNLANDTNLYGQMFYYLDGGSVFTHTIHGFGLKTKSMHGYHPDADGNLGLFVSNRKIKVEYATLPDVFTTSIKSLGIEYEEDNKINEKNILS